MKTFTVKVVSFPIMPLMPLPLPLPMPKMTETTFVPPKYVFGLALAQTHKNTRMVFGNHRSTAHVEVVTSLVHWYDLQ
jgi:hypothetical protein